MRTQRLERPDVHLAARQNVVLRVQSFVRLPVLGEEAFVVLPRGPAIDREVVSMSPDLEEQLRPEVARTA
jgi:hypothetical protein